MTSGTRAMFWMSAIAVAFALWIMLHAVHGGSIPAIYQIWGTP